MIAEQNAELNEERVQYQLQVQANQIQKVLNHHGTSTSVTGGVIDNRSFEFNLLSPLTAGLEKLSLLKEDLKKAMGVEAVRLNRHKGQLNLQVVRPVNPAVPLLDLMSRISYNDSCSAVLGLAEDGSVVRHDFAAKDTPNILICGEMNAGKTVLLRTIAATLAMTNRQADVQLVAINPTSVDGERRNSQDILWRPLNYIPHMLTDVVNRQTEIAELMMFLVREMLYRSEHSFSHPRIVVLIDQAATVMERGGRTVTESILRIAERGAESGIHLVMASRRPQANCFSPHLLTNLQARFVGNGCLESIITQDERTALNAATLLGEGDFLAGGLSRPVRFQAAFIDDYDLHMGLSKLYRNRPILLAKPLSTRTQLNPSGAQLTTKQSFAFTDGLVSVT